MRAYKTVNDNYIEPISFTVPRRAETFQADIFPPAVGTRAAASTEEWFDGKTAIPVKIDFESIYEGGAPKEVPSDFKPPPVKQASAASPKRAETAKKTAEEEVKTSLPLRSAPPTLQEQKGSISAMATKFQDKEENGADSDENTEFEEAVGPAHRSSIPFSPESKAAGTAVRTRTGPVASPTKPSSPLKSVSAPVAAAVNNSSSPSSSSVESSLQQIKQLIENQTKIISAQNDKIGLLAGEVESLRRRVGSGSQDQIERIRELELELEEARS